MAEYTPNLNLLKKDPITDGNDTFNIETMLNNNWDKIDANKKVQDDAINKIANTAKKYANEQASGLAKKINNKVDKVTGKGLSDENYTLIEKNKLAGIETGAQKNKVTSVNGKTGAVTITKSNVGLGNVSNSRQATKSEFDTFKNSTNKQLTNTKGTVSGSSDTGTVTTSHLTQVNVSSSSKSSGPRSQINASTDSTITSGGGRSQINASDDSTISATLSQINASARCIVKGTSSAIIASKDSIINEALCVIMASDGLRGDGCETKEWGSAIISGRNVVNPTNFTVCGGIGSGSSSAQNRKWELSSNSGTIKASGAITGNSSFADFAEYFESFDGKSIPLGTIVSLTTGGKIKPAQEGEYMIGIISQTAGVILNAQGFEWKDRYLYDRYGQPILVDKEVEDEPKIYKMYQSYLKSNEGKENISFDEYKSTLPTIPMTTIKEPMLNPNWDETQKYIPREDREEWNVVGLTGQIYTNIDDTISEGDFIQVGENGIATKGRNEYGQNWQVMKITTPYQEDLGFGIAIVFVR